MSKVGSLLKGLKRRAEGCSGQSLGVCFLSELTARRVYLKKLGRNQQGAEKKEIDGLEERRVSG